MKVHTSNFKNEISIFGKQIDAQIIYNYGLSTIDGESIFSFKPYFNVELFKTIMKGFKFECNIKIPSKTWVKGKFGLLVNDDYEYLNYGNFYINEDAEYSADNESYTHEAYDKMIESMIYYDDNPLVVEYPISYKNYIIAICNMLNWEYVLPETFPNMNTEIEEDLYINLGYTYRDILDDICPASMGNFGFNSDDKFTIIYPIETNDYIEDEYLKDVNVAFGKKVGPINSLVLSRSSDSDTINRTDSDSINENGIHEINIKDSILLSTEYRENFIDEMFSYIDGFEYYVFDVSSTGICYYDPLDKLTFNHNDVYYPTIILNDEISIEDGLAENLYSPELEESSTDYSTSSTTDKATKMATIIAYKNQAKIETITKQTNENSSNISTLTQTVNGFTTTIEQVDDLKSRTSTLENSVDGIDLKLTQVGGNNLWINPIGLQDGGKSTDAYGWTGVCKAYTDTYVQSNYLGKSVLLLQNGTRSQIQKVPNGAYTLSFKYEKKIHLANCHIELNGEVIELTEETITKGTKTITVNSNSIETKLISDTNDACYFGENMLVPGSVAQTYSSNATEVVTGNVKIGDGIEVSSNSSNIMQKINNDGNRIINTNTQETITQFTDKGIDSKEGNFDKLRASSLQFSDVGNGHTWITRL